MYDDAFRPQKKSWLISVSFQAAAVALLFTMASTKVVQSGIVRVMPLIAPNLAVYQLKPAHVQPGKAGGSGGGRDVLPASKGRTPRPALREFVAPSAVVNNANPRFTMESTILAPPDMQLPQVNMANYGDPLGKLGPLSNGPGRNGGIGDGANGGIGPGTHGGCCGPGDGDGPFGDGVYRLGTGVTAPALLRKVEPEYSEEARRAKYQGTVSLAVVIDASGRVAAVRVLHSLGLGLDERAIEAVRKWKFAPGTKDGRPVSVAATIDVSFRLL